jgi:hypothetical protein
MVAFKKPTAEDAELYMEICGCLIAREGGEIFIPQSEFVNRGYSIARRFEEQDGQPGLVLRLVLEQNSSQ